MYQSISTYSFFTSAQLQRAHSRSHALIRFGFTRHHLVLSGAIWFVGHWHHAACSSCNIPTKHAATDTPRPPLYNSERSSRLVNDYNDVLRQGQSQPPMTLRERRRAKRTQLPVLRHLTSLTIHHHTHSFDLVRDRNVFCSFVRRLIAHSKLRSLVLSRQRLSSLSDGTLSASYNALLAHLCAKHGS
jgi:hypothetical protein